MLDRRPAIDRHTSLAFAWLQTILTLLVVTAHLYSSYDIQNGFRYVANFSGPCISIASIAGFAKLLKRGNLTEEQRIHFKSVCKTRKDIISERCNFGLEDKPLLLIYRIKKDGGVPQKRSEHLREKMDAQRDIIGISIIVSGESIGESHAKTLRIRM